MRQWALYFFVLTNWFVFVSTNWLLFGGIVLRFSFFFFDYTVVIVIVVIAVVELVRRKLATWDV